MARLVSRYFVEDLAHHAVRSAALNGFAMKCVPGSSTPWWPMASSVYSDMKRTRRVGYSLRFTFWITPSLSRVK